jgi:hypothetical protein
MSQWTRVKYITSTQIWALHQIKKGTFRNSSKGRINTKEKPKCMCIHNRDIQIHGLYTAVCSTLEQHFVSVFRTHK